jgi:hypothetical protein
MPNEPLVIGAVPSVQGRRLSNGQQRNDALRRPAGFVLRAVNASDMLRGNIPAGKSVKGYPRACGVYGD